MRFLKATPVINGEDNRGGSVEGGLLQSRYFLDNVNSGGARDWEGNVALGLILDESNSKQWRDC